MKNISLILLLLVNYTLFSQETAKYYRQGNKTFNEIEYKVHKESYLNDFKKLFPDATLSEEFIKTILTTDSTIVYFTLGLHVIEKEEIKSTFSNEPIYSMIGKKFPFEQFPSLNEKEILVSIKTKANFYQKIEKEILANHSYKMPQIIAIKIDNGTKGYFDWIEDLLTKKD